MPTIGRVLDENQTATGGTAPGNDVPFVRLYIGKGLDGITRLQWRHWTELNWLTIVVALLFLIGAGALISVTTHTGPSEPYWHTIARWGLTIGLGVLVTVRIIIEKTVSKPPPGQSPPGDDKPVDKWTYVHMFAGVVLGLWLTPLLVTVVTTAAWECVEVGAPGLGDREVNSNRLIDIFVAGLGWMAAAGISAAISNQPFPLM